MEPKNGKGNLRMVVPVPERGGAPPDPGGGTESRGKGNAPGVKQLSIDPVRLGALLACGVLRSRCLPLFVGVSQPRPSDPAGMDVLDSTYEGSGQSKAPRSG